jgi:hypothetical protein
MNAFHCVAFRPKERRSASASSALASALSSTNSLTDRRKAAAAACNASLSARLSRKSSFSLRVVRDGTLLPPYNTRLAALPDNVKTSAGLPSEGNPKSAALVIMNPV